MEGSTANKLGDEIAEFLKSKGVSRYSVAVADPDSDLSIYCYSNLNWAMGASYQMYNDWKTKMES